MCGTSHHSQRCGMILVLRNVASREGACLSQVGGKGCTGVDGSLKDTDALPCLISYSPTPSCSLLNCQLLCPSHLPTIIFPSSSSGWFSWTERLQLGIHVGLPLSHLMRFFQGLVTGFLPLFLKSAEREKNWCNTSIIPRHVSDLLDGPGNEWG